MELSDSEWLVWIQTAAREAALGRPDDLELLLGEGPDIPSLLHHWVPSMMSELAGSTEVATVFFQLIDAQDWEILLQLAPACFDESSRELLEIWIDDVSQAAQEPELARLLAPYYRRFPIPLMLRVVFADALIPGIQAA